MDKKEGYTKTVPPYLPYKTLINFIDSLKVGLPPRIDKSLMKSMSGGMQSQLMVALEYLKLIAPKTGEVQPSMNLIVQSDGAQKQETLKNILVDGYPFLFQEGIDLSRITQQQLREIFEKTGSTGDTLRKSISFFLKAAKSSGIKISPHIKTTRGPRTGFKQKKKANLEQEQNGQELGKKKTLNIPIDTPLKEISLEKIIADKFPAFNPEWSSEVQAKWFDGFKELITQIKKTE
ncbi:MAG: hypothetical protein A2Y79_11660 [Deltaproteobacteria bacterium RBG_13_43_22]|nr:MAG: hypothetical protein A2Y79_11660 [Deltaproteobacteria bacterium RBG_13_43_22]